MPTLGDIDRHGKIQANVRNVLELCVRQRCEDPLDEPDDTLLVAAASAQTGLLIMDAVMKHFGRRSPAHAKAYGDEFGRFART
jgi:hypothetical protein